MRTHIHFVLELSPDSDNNELIYIIRPIQDLHVAKYPDGSHWIIDGKFRSKIVSPTWDELVAALVDANTGN